jgi:glycosidase
MKTKSSLTAVVLCSSIAFLASCGFGRRPEPSPPPSATPTATPTATLTATPVAQWDNDWSRGCAFYEVFVRSFYDSNGDGIGDLPGLIAKLDYLNDGDPATTRDLGVEGIWLMPIFQSPSYHGYDTTDYTLVNPDYGTNEDLARLLDEAHRRGMHVILDFVMNHVSAQHPWFVAAQSPASAKRSWFVWRRDDPGWTQPWGGANPTWHEAGGSYYYGVFWGGMPDLNFRHREVRRQIEESAAFWLTRGVDGFRLDATRHLIEDGPGQKQVDTPETHGFLKEFSASVRAIKPQATLVGENWTDTPIIAEYYGSAATIRGGDELPMNFNFPLAGAIMNGVGAGDGEGIASKIAEIQAAYPPGVNDATFLTNHDMVRVATQLRLDPAKLRLAATVLFTLPGTPFVYYGEEIGLRNGTTNNDEAKRTPMPWSGTSGAGFSTGTPWFPFAPGSDAVNVTAQGDDPGSLLAHYRNLIHLRAATPALRSGEIQNLSTSGQSPSILAFVRVLGRERLLVVHNLGDSPVTAGPFDLPASSMKSVFTDGEAGPPVLGVPGGWQIPLAAHATGIWKTE